MNIWAYATAVLAPLTVAVIMGLLFMWRRLATVEQTIYGQKGEMGLVARVEALRPFIHDRANAAAKAIAEVDGKAEHLFREHYTRLEERVRILERTIPRRRSES